MRVEPLFDELLQAVEEVAHALKCGRTPFYILPKLDKLIVKAKKIGGA